MITGPASWIVVSGVPLLAGVGLWMVRRMLLPVDLNRAPSGQSSERRQLRPWSWSIAVGWAFVFALWLLGIAAWWWLLIAGAALIEALVADFLLARRRA